MPATIRTADDHPIAALKPAPRNARTHTKDQVAQIAASIREFGFTNPILAEPDGTIIAGHGRLDAAKQLRLQSVPVRFIEGLTEGQKRALAIADNQIALNAGWDNAVLRAEIEALAALDVNLDLLGFDADSLAALTAPPATAGLVDEEETPPLPTEPTTRSGDVWILGHHRIICGDSTDAGTVGKLLGKVRPHLMVTDPPYGVEYDPAWRKRAGVNNGGAMGVVLNDDRGSWREAWALFPGEVAYVWHGERQMVDLALELRECGFEVRNLIVWGKTALVVGRGNYHSQHESCWYVVRKGATGHWHGDRKQTTLWQIAKPQKSETGHSTQKPVECMRRPVENNSSPGQVVYEPFSGSGTTIIACEATGRICFAVELNPAYVDVAVTRWQQFTGETAYLEDDGRNFAEISAERVPVGIPVTIAEPDKKKAPPRAGGASKRGTPSGV